MSELPGRRDRTVRLPRGLTVAYRDWGGSGPPIILVHGLASSYTIWDLVAPRLAARFRVVALDQRGHGRSDKPDGAFDLSTYAGDLRAFVAALGLGRVLLVGHSWGGNVVLQCGVEAPELTAGLVLVDGGFLELSARPGWSWERVERELAPPNLTGLTREQLLQRARQGDLATAWSPAVAASVLGHFEQLPDGQLRPWLRREHHMQILRALWEHHPSELWEAVCCPVLLLPARRSDDVANAVVSPAVKERQVALAEARLARSRTMWLEETIHDVPLQRPAELAAAIAEFAEKEADWRSAASSS